MTVEQTDVVDVYTNNPDTRQVLLTISDHLDWDNKENLFVRQEKINKYLEFIESGEIWDSLKLPNDSSVQIELVVNKAGFEFIYNVGEDIASDKTKQLQSSLTQY